MDYNIETNTYSDGFSTTFWQDFSIADHTIQLKQTDKNLFSFANVEPTNGNEDKKIKAIKDTFNRAFKEWKKDYRYLTDLVLQLNHKIWQWYEVNEEIAEVYNELWLQADKYACTHLKGEELKYFYRILD